MLEVFEAVVGTGEALFEIADVGIDTFNPSGDLAELAFFGILEAGKFFFLLQANFFDALLDRKSVV